MIPAIPSCDSGEKWFLVLQWWQVLWHVLWHFSRSLCLWLLNSFPDIKTNQYFNDQNSSELREAKMLFSFLFFVCFLGHILHLAPSVMNLLSVCRVAFLRWFWEPCNYICNGGEGMCGTFVTAITAVIKRQRNRERITRLFLTLLLFRDNWTRPEWVWQVFLKQWLLSFWQRRCTATCSTTRWSTSSLPSAGWTTSWWGNCHYAAQSDSGTPTRYTHTHTHTTTHTHSRPWLCRCYMFKVCSEWICDHNVWNDMNNGQKHYKNMDEIFSQGTTLKWDFFFLIPGLFNHLDFL